jgi:cytochrome c553
MWGKPKQSQKLTRMASSPSALTVASLCIFCLAASASVVAVSGSHQGPLTHRDNKRSARRSKYLGDSSCISCHRSQGTSYLNTSHHLTSQNPTTTSVLGDFKAGGNSLTVLDPQESLLGVGLSFTMEDKGGHFYQTARRSEIDQSNGHTRVHSRRERIDIVTGSGIWGQTYLYWRGNQLYELPISSWSVPRQWINSPGYEDGTDNFNRPVYPRCLECHATYIKPLSDSQQTNSYQPESLQLGISCETCHGPGADHISFEKSGLSHQSEDRRTIFNPAHVSRDRQVDLCGLCHNGTKRQAMRLQFSYIPGEPLSTYLGPEAPDESAQPEVHGNQVALLKKSKCYRMSPDFSCASCHDVHAPERPAATYSSRCLSCHTIKSCGMFETLGHQIDNGCITCHMPEEPTGAIVSRTGGKIVRARMRTHWIKVYKDETTLSPP